jgi:hypothetical protein
VGLDNFLIRVRGKGRKERHISHKYRQAPTACSNKPRGLPHVKSV